MNMVLKMRPVGGEMIELGPKVISLDAAEQQVLESGAQTLSAEQLEKVMDRTKNTEVAAAVLELEEDEIIRLRMRKYAGNPNDGWLYEHREKGIKADILRLKKLTDDLSTRIDRRLAAGISWLVRTVTSRKEN